MIVRCTSCVSAFAVDDDKVANRKFAFTCPKCGTENIFDNRKQAEKRPSDEMFFEEKEKKPTSEDLSFGDDLGSEEAFFDEHPAAPEQKERKKLNLELEEASASQDEEISFDDDFMIEEKPAKKAAPAEEELTFDEDIFEEEKPAKKTATAEEELTFDEDIFKEEKPAKKAAPAEEELTFDEDIFEEEKPAKKAAPAEEELTFDDEYIIDETESPEELKKSKESEDDLLDIGLELESEKPEKVSGDRDVKMSSQDDIDAMFADLPAEAEPAPAISPKKGEVPEDEITVDLDELDIELEGDLDTSNDEIISFDETEKVPSKRKPVEEPLFDEDITIDMDSLDIDIEEAGDFQKPGKKDQGEEEEELILNVDEFDEDFEHGEKAPAVKSARKEISPEDDITLDLDSLDIDLDESEAQAIPAVKTVRGKEKISDEIEDEEDLKLHLDEMDMDIEELEKKDLLFDEDIITEPAPKHKKKAALIEESDEDESITIDLETLDIDVAETPEIMTGEMTEEEEKLTLDDAGLTFSELSDEEKTPGSDASEEDELFLSIDEIDPDLKLQVIGEEAPRGEKPLSETVAELPEIDLEEYEAVVREEKFRPEREYTGEIEGLEELEELETMEVPAGKTGPVDLDILEYEEEGEEKYTPEKGSTTFSIDYSLKYSRLGAVLRITGLYMLSMIPHFVVMLVYSILSGILGFINQIVILSTGRCVEDFSLITENTLRYLLYIDSNICGIVEDRPVYAGRESISHQLQLNVIFPLKYSRNMAILRLSIVGIIIITLPHLIFMSLLMFMALFAYVAGLIAVIITRRWPNPLFIFLTRCYRYFARISTFMLGLTDEYPTFRFD